MPTIAAQITEAGASGPSYADILQELRIAYWGIYGSDAVLDPDSQDGQFLAVLAQAIFDCNQSTIDAYNSFAPNTARGVGLSNLVKLNGLRRAVPTRSKITVTLGGTIGTQIVDGAIGDNVGLQTRWSLPALVTIPDSGAIDVTVTCTIDGAVAAGANTLTQILTPTRGWQSVTNGDNAAVAGEPVETDAQLHARQSRSVALSAVSILESIDAAIGAVAGVLRLRVYENDNDVPDADGLPSHSIAAVVFGGDIQEIAGAIALKKAPGGSTFGTTSVIVVDSRGVPNTIHFFQLAVVPLTMQITIHPLPGAGYVSTTGEALVQSVVNFVNSYDIGEDSYLSRLYSPANLGGVGAGATYVVTAITQSRGGGPLAAADVAIAFNEGATLDAAHVTLALV